MIKTLNQVKKLFLSQGGNIHWLKRTNITLMGSADLTIEKIHYLTYTS